MYNTTRFLFIFFIISFTGCLEPFTFDENPDAVRESIVVDGVVSPGFGPYTLRLTTTATFGFKGVTPYTGAKATLIGPEERRITYVEQEEGVYVIVEGVVEVREGLEYQLELELRDGRIYRSSAQIVPRLVSIDSVRHKFRDERIVQDNGRERLEVVIGVQVDFTINASNATSFLRWRVDELFSFSEQSCGPLHRPKTCYFIVDPDIRQLALFKSSQVALGTVEDYEIFVRGNLTPTEFKDKHVFSIYQYSLTEASFDYWSRVNTLVQQGGTIFDIPPAPHFGNLVNQDNSAERLLGYFDVVSVDTIRTPVFPSEFRQYSRQVEICNIFERFRWPAICCECTGIPMVGTTRPSWF